MKIEQFRQDLTTEQLNDTLGKVFGTSIDLTKFSTEQLEAAQNQVLDKIATIEQTEAFDQITHNEDYHKQKMFLDVITSALKDRKATEGGNAFDIARGDAEREIEDSNDEKEAIDRIQSHMYTDPKNADESYANSELTKLIDEIKEKGLGSVQNRLAQQDGPYESNAFAQAVQKAKAAGMKKGDKFKVGDKEYTLEDMEKLVDTMQNSEVKEKAKPDYIDLDKDGNKTEPMKKAAKDKEDKKKVKEGAEEEASLVMAAKDMVDKVTGWMEDTASMQTETILELGDAIRDEEGTEKSESFINAVKPALESLYTSLEATREALTGGVAVLTGEGAPTDTMGADAEEPAMEPTDDADMDMPDQSDDFGASEPATGGEEPADREKRESFIRLSRRLAETLSTRSKKKA